MLARLWPLVNDRMNYLTPTKKPAGYGADRHGRRTRLHDKPRPLQRLLASRPLLIPHPFRGQFLVEAQARCGRHLDMRHYAA